jgi:hypothetical protein
VPALSSSLIGPALEQVADLPAGDRELLAAGHLSLLEHLARVPDPRKRRGVRHSLSSVLAAAIAAVLAGAQSFTAIGEWIADAPPHVLSSLGIRRDPLTRRPLVETARQHRGPRSRGLGPVRPERDDHAERAARPASRRAPDPPGTRT